jgi:uncharacterized protein YndB with AHSA1/START domain
MTTTRSDTQIVVDDKVPLVRIIREFDAPAAKVYRAHAEPELFAQWIGPDRLSAVIDEFDFRSGGSYRFRNVAEGEEYGFRGCFHEVRPGELIVQTFTFEGEPDGVALEKLTFTDIGEGRCRLESTSLVDSFEARDAFVASGMEEGVKEGYARLDEVLTAL